MTHVWCLVSSRHARSVLDCGGPPPLLRTCMQVRVISAQQTFRHLLRDVLKPLHFLRYLLLKLSSMHSTQEPTLTNLYLGIQLAAPQNKSAGAPAHSKTLARILIVFAFT